MHGLQDIRRFFRSLIRILKKIDTFIMMRRLQLTAWLASHQESGPVAELSVGWMDGTMELAERYLRLFG